MPYPRPSRRIALGELAAAGRGGGHEPPPPPPPPEMADHRPADTLLLVDVDGVLNVGVRDHGEAPLLFNEPNVRFAESMRGRRAATKADQESIDKLLAVVDQPLGDEEGTYLKFICRQSSHITEVLAQRLAALVEAAGERSTVVLSSNWRRSSHASRVRKLEEEVAHHLGRPFAFDGTTKQADEKRAVDRLRCLGEYVADMAADPARGGRPLRVLLLEDFFITPLDGSWECDGSTMASPEAVEQYVRGCAAPWSLDVAVKMVHTYSEWRNHNGLRVQVGRGLSARHMQEAEAFLRYRRPLPVADAEPHSPLPSMPATGEVLLRQGETSSTPTEAVAAANLLDKSVVAWPWFSVYLRFAA